MPFVPPVFFTTIFYEGCKHDKQPKPLHVWKFQTIPLLEMIEFFEEFNGASQLIMSKYPEYFYDTEDRYLMKRHNVWVKKTKGEDVVVKKLKGSTNGNRILVFWLIIKKVT